MAKSKKNKKKNRHSTNNKPKISYNTNEQELWLYGTNVITSAILMDRDSYPLSSVGKIIRNEYKRKMGCSDEYIEDVLQDYNKNRLDEKTHVDYLKKFYADILTRHPAVDKTLNIYHPESDWQTTPDMIDFRQYVFPKNEESEKPIDYQDVLADSHYYATYYHDNALLWSPSKYTVLQLTDSVFYIIRRDKFDETDNSVTYTCIMYKCMTLLASHTCIIPVCIFEIQSSIKTLTDIETTLTCMPDEVVNHAIFEEYMDVLRENDWYDMHVIDVMVAENVSKDEARRITDEEIKNDFRTVCYKTKAITSPWDMSRYHLKYYKNDSLYKLEDSLVNNIHSEYMFDTCLYTGQENISNQLKSYIRIREYMSVPLAMILIMNGMLRSEKLSRPDSKKTANIQTSANIKYKIKSDSDNMTAETKRKTRHVGGIKLTTSDRPRPANIKQIIHFTKSEWSVKAHTRTYKSGKVAFIKPTTAHRKCVDMSGVKNTTNTGKKYIVHNEQIEPNT